MGDRFYVTITCPQCGESEKDFYYAPTCSLGLTWTCPGCSYVLDVGKYTGISYEDASNRQKIKRLVENL